MSNAAVSRETAAFLAGFRCRWHRGNGTVAVPYRRYGRLFVNHRWSAGVVLRAANLSSNDCRGQSHLNSGAARPTGLIRVRNVGVGVPDDPSGKFDLDGQIFPHTELPPSADGMSRTPSPTFHLSPSAKMPSRFPGRALVIGSVGIGKDYSSMPSICLNRSM